MTFPLDSEFAREFAEGLETILVIEEKRSFLELHLRDALYALATRPAVIGKIDAQGAPLFPPSGELDPDKICESSRRVVGTRGTTGATIARRARAVDRRSRSQAARARLRFARHRTSVPAARTIDRLLLLPGQVAGGGIGCHTMGMRLTDSNRSFSFLTQMGGEGAPWIGMAPFVGHEHMFQNIGDGTFFHSGRSPCRR